VPPFLSIIVRLVLVVVGVLPAVLQAQPSTPNPLETLLTANAERLGPVLADPLTHRVQILYTQIDRDAEGRPHFRSFRHGVAPETYFYPASTVKLPVALLALEALHRQGIPGLDRDTVMLTGAAHPSQTAVAADPTAPGGLPSVGHYVRKILLVSDNDAYNRLYEFLGQDAINAALRDRGYAGARIVHRLSSPVSTADNRRVNPVRFIGAHRTLLALGERVAEGAWLGETPIPLGVAEIVSGRRIEGPKDFSEKNALPLQALHDLVKAVIFPGAVPSAMRFDLSDEDLAFVRRAMATTPPESGIAAYADAEVFPPGYVKFLLFGGDATSIPPSIRIFNKVGDAYGFLTDAAYVVDVEAGIEYLLAATVYTNANGTFNDDRYEYAELGFPFLRELGQLIHAHELARPRAHRPDLSSLAQLFDAG
jgi:hypothetical protein